VWWTFAGTKANNSLVGALASTGIAATSNPESVTLASVKIDDLRGLASLLQVGITAATVDRQAVDGLKFSAALPLNLAVDTLAERGSDERHARASADEPVVVQQR